MDFTREINRLMSGIIVAFFIVAISSTYWAIVGPETIMEREDNPRLVEAEASIQRGAIYDYHEALLVESTVTEDGIVERRYLKDSMSSATGYFSLRYGVSSAEAAYDDILRGDTANTGIGPIFEQGILHRPQIGTDTRLTIDAIVQDTIVDLMGEKHGAAVLLSIPDGAIRSLVSLPTYDPNHLDDDWEVLIDASGNPFFNRVLQGQYQPGGTLQTLLITANILANQSLDQPIPDADSNVIVDDLTLHCVTPPPQPTLTLAEAYAYGCPYPFVQLIERTNPVTLNNLVNSFRLDTPPTIAGFENAFGGDEENNSEFETVQDDEPNNLVHDLLGQGNISINPLSMVTIVAAIINNGQSPQPYMLEATRAPDELSWEPVPRSGTTIPIMTSNAAQTLRNLMIANTEQGVVQRAAQDDLVIGGHVAMSLSGDETRVWFVGFAENDAGSSVALAIVLEDTNDVIFISELGGTILETAINHLHSIDD